MKLLWASSNPWKRWSMFKRIFENCFVYVVPRENKKICMCDISILYKRKGPIYSQTSHHWPCWWRSHQSPSAQSPSSSSGPSPSPQQEDPTSSTSTFRKKRRHPRLSESVRSSKQTWVYQHYMRQQISLSRIWSLRNNKTNSLLAVIFKHALV